MFSLSLIRSSIFFATVCLLQHNFKLCTGLRCYSCNFDEKYAGYVESTIGEPITCNAVTNSTNTMKCNIPLNISTVYCLLHIGFKARNATGQPVFIVDRGCSGESSIKGLPVCGDFNKIPIPTLREEHLKDETKAVRVFYTYKCYCATDKCNGVGIFQKAPYAKWVSK